MLGKYFVIIIFLHYININISGLYLKMHNYNRPESMKREVIRRRKRVDANQNNESTTNSKVNIIKPQLSPNHHNRLIPHHYPPPHHSNSSYLNPIPSTQISSNVTTILFEKLENEHLYNQRFQLQSEAERLIQKYHLICQDIQSIDTELQKRQLESQSNYYLAPISKSRRTEHIYENEDGNLNGLPSFKNLFLSDQQQDHHHQ